ncbi:MAG: endonuclease/exonuclease/phosphatase family protein [Deltaproteobacteria bacterium]|jgi:endonuclease/exonuclease/phosphatase family metal-dependent hydrolase|nr:endonuclease/exonuclease/phosphatase family protein [Deltaproteobacteria bacterium]
MFSVLTLNLRFGLADDGTNSWRYRKKGFQPFLEKYRTELICFQEANDFQIAFLHNILTEYNYVGKRSPSPPFWQNNVIFYQKDWHCIYYEHFFLSPTPLVPSRYRKSIWPRQCTMGMFETDRRQVICINTHLDFDVSVQIKSAKLILDRLSHLPRDIPAILTGDFNAAPFSPCYNIFTGQENKTAPKESYFKNAFKKPFTGTHHGFTGNTDGDAIDWILFRGKMTLINSKVIQDTFKNIYLSDHFPLCAQFTLGSKS